MSLDVRQCQRPNCDHAAYQHGTAYPERQVFICEVEGCDCASWLYEAAERFGPSLPPMQRFAPAERPPTPVSDREAMERKVQAVQLQCPDATWDQLVELGFRAGLAHARHEGGRA